MNVKPLVVWLILTAVLVLIVGSALGVAGVVSRDRVFIENVAGMLIALGVIVELLVSFACLVPTLAEWARK
jgi:hypothetical protein